MKLDKVILVNWGSLRSEEYPMGNMTLLTGPTGSGKSSFLDALQTVMTAAHQNLFSYNPGQDETNQSTRNGKTKRTLWSYIVGAEDNLFARPDGAHGYIAAVFKPDDGEEGSPFTALLGAAARVDGTGARRVAVQERLALLIIDDASLAMSDLRDVMVNGAYQIYPVEKIEDQLRQKYSQVTNFRDSKREYLCQLYGRFRGRKTVSFQEAELAAKAWSQSIAHKPIGSVDELVKQQILEHDPQQLSQRISQISDLMRQMHGLRVEGERLDANVTKLERVGGAIQRATHGYESAVQYQLLASRRTLQEDECQINEAHLAVAALEGKVKEEGARILGWRAAHAGLVESQIQIEATLRGIPAVDEKRRIEEKLSSAKSRAAVALVSLVAALEAAALLQERARHVTGMEFPPDSDALAVAAAEVAAVLGTTGQWPLATYLRQACAIKDDMQNVRELQSLAQHAGQLRDVFAPLHTVLYGTQHSFVAAAQQQAATLNSELNKAVEEVSTLARRMAALADGGTDYPNEIAYALRMMRSELPGAGVQVLCDMVDPTGTAWQPAIEGYLAGARFNLIVDMEWEARAIQFVRQRNLRAKVIQGSLCLKHARDERVPTDSIIHELHTEHPVAKAYLVEQYGQVVKVADVDTLRETPRGVMQDGKSSGARTLFVAEVRDHLVFGKEAKRQARERVVAAHQQAEDTLRILRGHRQNLNALLGLLGNTLLPDFAVAADLELAALGITVGEADLARVDLSEAAELEAEKATLKLQVEALNELISKADTRIGQYTTTIQGHSSRAASLGYGLEAKREQLARDEEHLHLLCTVNDAAVYSQLEGEVAAFLTDQPLSSGQIQERIRWAGEQAREAHGDVREELAEYNQTARSDEQLYLLHGEGQRGSDFAPIYGALVALRKQVKQQLDVQREVGLRQNLDKLRRAEASFNDVFTKQFCYEIRNAVDSGVKTLRALNNELERLKFGTDKFRIDWSAWVPEFEAYYKFFSAAYDLSESQESGDLFGATTLSPEEAKVRDQLSALLLSNDQARALKELQRIADYRNYRRYEIWKESDSGAKVALSEWGTGSGGQLETPAYIVRAAVVTNRLKHFEKGTNLKMIVNDESFAKMDERRAHDVIRFIRDSLGIQLICAMPTKHAGALKPEFTKEWSFTRTDADGNGEVDFVSEADERDLNPDKLRERWEARRQQVRMQAQIAFEAAEQVAA